VLASLAVIGGLAALRLLRRARMERRSQRAMRAARAAGVQQPPTLHPVIDPDRCIGSGSCTRVCPLGDDVIGLILGRGALLDPSHCIGHGTCAEECPVHAIRLVFGTSERGVDIPTLASTFETNVPGLYITGELGGMGLIRNAVEQAVEGIGHLQDALRADAKAATRRGGDAAGAASEVGGQREGELLDVAIVGAGPAGLAAALTAQREGLSYRMLEREPTVGGAVLHYPRRKLVVTEPVRIPLLGRVHVGTLVKEQLVELWQEAVHKHKLKLEAGVQVKAVLRQDDGTFVVRTSRDTLRARKVMLCIGRRGTPRKLDVPGEESSKVGYVLRDASTFGGQRVLVVGGGDSAVEAACGLAEESDAEVTLSYRRAAISRARPANRTRLQALIDAGRVRTLYGSVVQEITADAVRLQTPSGELSVPNDHVLVCAGGQLPTEFLATAGVRMERHFGEEKGGEDPRDAQGVFERIRAQKKAEGLLDLHTEDHATHVWLPRIALLLTGAGLAAGVALGGEGYLSATLGDTAWLGERFATYLPTGMVGQTLGVAALVLMLVNVSYFLRKELRVLTGLGTIHTWMQVHIASGLATGALTLLHAGFRLQNLYGLSLYISLGVVILTGVVGRYIYGFVPHDPRGRPLAHAALRSLARRLAHEQEDLFPELEQLADLKHVLQDTPEQPLASLGDALRVVFGYPLRALRVRRLIRQATERISEPQRREDFVHFAREVFRLRMRMGALPVIKRLMGLWRAGHAVLAGFMLALIAVHVGVAFWVGYRWIFG